MGLYSSRVDREPRTELVLLPLAYILRAGSNARLCSLAAGCIFEACPLPPQKVSLSGAASIVPSSS